MGEHKLSEKARTKCKTNFISRLLRVAATMHDSEFPRFLVKHTKGQPMPQYRKEGEEEARS